MPDNVVSLRPWDAALRRAKSKVADLLDRSDAAAAIASLSPLEAYTAVKGLGPSDAAPLLGHLTRDQMQSLWDLEAWRGDRIAVDDAVLWMSAYREASLEAMQRAAAAMDFEAIGALLRRRLYVGFKPREDRSDEDPVPDWMAQPTEEIEPLMETPDGRFIIAARPYDEDEGDGAEPVDDEDRKWILTFVAELYQQEHWEDVAAMLRAASSDLTSALEETAYRFRSARLEDLGFPPRERAMEIYGLEDPGPGASMPDAPVVDLYMPTSYAPPLQQGLLHAALQAIDDPKVMRRLEGDLVAVANKALVADGVEPGRTEAVQEVLQRLRGYVELALAEGAPPAERVAAASRRLQADHLERLFRVGYTLTVRAGGRARRLLQDMNTFVKGGRDGALRRLGAAEQGVLEALLLSRPRVSGALEPVAEALAEGTDVPPDVALDPGASEARRPFLSPADLGAARWALDDLEAFIEAWRQRPPQAFAEQGTVNLPPEERTLDVELATAAAAVILGHGYTVRPVTASELADLADRVTAAQGRPQFSADTVAEVLDHAGGPRLERRVRRVLGALAEQLWPHAGRDRIDPRFIEAIVTAV